MASLHETRGPELQAVCSTFVSLALMATILRIYTRTRIVKAFGADDWWMVAALCFHIMFATCASGGIHYGTGRHMAALSDEQRYRALRYWWLCYIAYCWTMITSKISIGIFLLRLTIKKMHKWIIFIAMGFTVLTGLVFFFVTLFQCTPVNFFWDKTIQDAYCVNVDIIIGLTFLYSAVSVISDFTFAILPFFLIWGLNMSVKTRALLIPVLGLACVASVAVVVRMAYVMDFKDPDFLWATMDIAIWSDIEQGLAITAGSLATLRPLWRQLSASLGLLSTSGPSNPSGMRTPQWNGDPTASEERKKLTFMDSFKALFQTEKGSVSKEIDAEYGMGNLAPIRLVDNQSAEHEKDEKVFNTWRIEAGGSRVLDEEFRIRETTLEAQMNQKNERQ